MNYRFITDDYTDFKDRNIIRWVYINGIKTKYMVTVFGEVISIKKETKKILKHSIDKDGYHFVTIHINGVKHKCGVHRLVAMAFIPNPENKPEVNHRDGDKDENCVGNLEWVTTKENIHHAWNSGLSTAKRGKDHPESKYTEDQIIQVCKYLEKNKKTMMEISEITGVSYTVVKQIRNHIIWKSVSEKFDIDNYSVDSRRRKKK